jgi:hypothetical protein
MSRRRNGDIMLLVLHRCQILAKPHRRQVKRFYGMPGGFEATAQTSRLLPVPLTQRYVLAISTPSAKHSCGTSKKIDI